MCAIHKINNPDEPQKCAQEICVVILVQLFCDNNSVYKQDTFQNHNIQAYNPN